MATDAKWDDQYRTHPRAKRLPNPRVFSTVPQLWINLQRQYDLKEFEAGEETAEIARDGQPRKGATA